MPKKLINLINNERTLLFIKSQKAATTDNDNAYCKDDSVDYCVYIDNAACSTYATDKCNKDYAGCMEGAWDICTAVYRDTDLCIGAGVSDIEEAPEA